MIGYCCLTEIKDIVKWILRLLIVCVNSVSRVINANYLYNNFIINAKNINDAVYVLYGVKNAIYKIKIFTIYRYTCYRVGELIKSVKHL